VTDAPADSGVYLFLFDLRRAATMRIGALGMCRLTEGGYGYVGSARRGLAARLGRHVRRRKPLRWHIDYVTRLGVPVGALVWPWRPGRECRLAAALGEAGAGRVAVPRFGASDCGCAGHLFLLSDSDLGALAVRLSEHLGAQPARVVRYG
jgi:sugar fermentation stimulation protein A